MIVKYQQIAPVIDRRRTMFPNDPTARFAARTTVVRIHHTERCSRADSPQATPPPENSGSGSPCRTDPHNSGQKSNFSPRFPSPAQSANILCPRRSQTSNCLFQTLHPAKSEQVRLCLHISQTSGSRNRERRSATAPPAGERFRPDAGHRKGSALRRAVYET